MTSPATDLAWVREVAGELGSLEAGHRVERSVEQLAGRFGSDITTYSHLALGPIAHTPVPAIDRLVDGILVRLQQHPLFEPLVAGTRAGPTGPIPISDVLSARQWRSHPFYSEMLRPYGIPVHTVCLPVTGSAEGELEWYQLNRDRDFSAKELELLNRVQPALIALVRRPPRASRPAGVQLTPRETELLVQLAQGGTVAAAARSLGMSTGTARKHVENIHRKLDTHGPIDTIRRATDLGLIPPAAR